MYGALIADQVQAPIPVVGEYPEYENAPSSGMGRFPDYDPDNESEDLYHLGGTGWSDTAVSLMATVGFDLLTTTLTSSSGDFVRFLVEFNNEVLQRPPLVDATNVYLPISAPSRRRRISWHCNDYIRLHRQRAWALFDDTRQYPQIPSVDEYRRVYGPGPVGGFTLSIAFVLYQITVVCDLEPMGDASLGFHDSSRKTQSSYAHLSGHQTHSEVLVA
ncbi:hypothetical protein CDV31_002751 [Fusarium ambrosium]|uniref:Uncharacterized protein n=1 Tax=Fusarium ambrosium TaxID=131363 RepID=A0A428UVZ9_9HYPO|nr:hypothetical protein CDV31_002751 [Fusarium ambrosium]